jgi:DNA-directed RNA polymerase subunit RPC12/RpoP
MCVYLLRLRQTELGSYISRKKMRPTSPRFICGQCNQKNKLNETSDIACVHCGYRILYKERQRRSKSCVCVCVYVCMCVCVCV